MFPSYYDERKRLSEKKKQRDKEAKERWRRMSDEERSQYMDRQTKYISNMCDTALNFLEANLDVTAVNVGGNWGWRGEFKCKHCPKVFIFNEWGRYKTQALNRMSEHLKTAHHIKVPYIYPKEVVSNFVDQRVNPIIYGTKEYCPKCKKEQYAAQGTYRGVPAVMCRECHTLLRNGIK
jgi:hypothetical protein